MWQLVEWPTVMTHADRSLFLCLCLLCICLSTSHTTPLPAVLSCFIFVASCFSSLLHAYIRSVIHSFLFLKSLLIHCKVTNTVDVCLTRQYLTSLHGSHFLTLINICFLPNKRLLFGVSLVFFVSSGFTPLFFSPHLQTEQEQAI